MNDERFLISWQRTREAGFRRYFLMRTLIGAGIVLIFVGRGAFLVPLTNLPLGAGLLFFAAMALSFIPFAWRRHEARYRGLLARSQRSAFD